MAETEAPQLSCIEVWVRVSQEYILRISAMAGWIVDMLFILFFAYNAV